MPPIANLSELIRTMQPMQQPGSYVFCTLVQLPPMLAPEALMIFREQEGITVIVTEAVAQQFGLPYSFVAAWITLQVHSALDAVGLTAAVATALTTAGVSCNVVAGYYHDHLFVPLAEGGRAVKVLEELARTG
ncbi:hypothetical protein SAMN05444008_11041 [Cnuella takakiae]|uniref:Uncharacterized protein n=1 Tax=Cnuella takakiae TaxID=1302690 RepID=A0A1M5D1P2_9BACT|nr:ACT domain-containing protein [Cnuella takakiae]OLY94135.1 acetyltransferase [Cnuella takakiae]SHF60953.1 hypothetical protein SAMN05444008_11041 [Cnuella takakiae]